MSTQRNSGDTTEQLIVVCNINEADRLDIRFDMDEMLNERLAITIPQKSVEGLFRPTAAVYVSIEDARAIFNWLGVMLHKPKVLEP